EPARARAPRLRVPAPEQPLAREVPAARHRGRLRRGAPLLELGAARARPALSRLSALRLRARAARPGARRRGRAASRRATATFGAAPRWTPAPAYPRTSRRRWAAHEQLVEAVAVVRAPAEAVGRQSNSSGRPGKSSGL